MPFTHYPFNSEWSGWERRQHIQNPLVVILRMQNSGTLVKITLNRISSWEDRCTSKRVNGNRRRWYAIKASSWNQTDDGAVTCFWPTRTPTALAYNKDKTMSVNLGCIGGCLSKTQSTDNLKWSLHTVFKYYFTQVAHTFFCANHFSFLHQYFWKNPSHQHCCQLFSLKLLSKSVDYLEYREHRFGKDTLLLRFSNVIFQCLE